MSFSLLFGIFAAIAFLSMILFAIFGWVTVRKLRKNPETKHELGFEFAYGWDILNVAWALTLPRSLVRKIWQRSKGFEANPDVLYEHTTVFDRVLARVFCIPFVVSGSGIIILSMASFFWGFD